VIELPRGGMEVAVEIGQIASGPGRIEQRAESLLETLRRLVPFRAAGMFLLDAEHAGLTPVADQGYDDAVRGYITSRANSDEIEMLGFNRASMPLRVQDLPVARERVRGWAEYLSPAGFREGLAVGLFTPDGRHLGLLGLNTDTERHPTAAARDWIGRLAPVIAQAIDPMRSAIRVAGVVADAQAGVVLTRAGDMLPMPGLPTHPLLGTDSSVMTVAIERLAAAGYSSFLCPNPATDVPDSHVRITVLACQSGAPHYLAAVVLLSPPGDLRSLTRRELEVLGMVVEGWPNQRIAAVLFVTRRTVNAHVEHILAKLGTATRTLAAVQALRFGLYVPRLLRGSRK
jgi:DNA-binding CsgD family transcriptional regulator